MISVIILIKNFEVDFVYVLVLFVFVVVEGVVWEVIIVDGGLIDNIGQIVDVVGCIWLELNVLCSVCVVYGVNWVWWGDWLLFLCFEMLLESGWYYEVQVFVEWVVCVFNGLCMVVFF